MAICVICRQTANKVVTFTGEDLCGYHYRKYCNKELFVFICPSSRRRSLCRFVEAESHQVKRFRKENFTNPELVPLSMDTSLTTERNRQEPIRGALESPQLFSPEPGLALTENTEEFLKRKGMEYIEEVSKQISAAKKREEEFRKKLQEAEQKLAAAVETIKELESIRDKQNELFREIESSLRKR